MQDTSPRAVLVYDGECALCREWAARLGRAAGERVDLAAYPEAAARFPEIPRERFRAAVQLVEPDGRSSQGAAAVFRVLAVVGRGGPWWLYRHVPAFAAASEWCYRLVAGHRDARARARS